MEILARIGQVALTSIFSIIALFVIAKFIGHRQISQLGAFDYINGITIGSIAAEMATELEEPWLPLTAIVVYGATAWLLSILQSKNARVRKYVDGTPSILFDEGKLFRENLKKAKLDLTEFMCMCRMEGYFDLREIQTAVYEYNGRLTILPKSQSRPMCPDDIGLSPKPAGISTEIIMDGRIMGENIKRMGANEVWLEHELEKQGYKSAKEIFLAVCDKEKNLTVYPAHDE